MALIHTIVNEYQYLVSWHVHINILDDSTGLLYSYESCFDHEPNSGEKDTEVTRLKAITQTTIDLVSNDMNLPLDEQLVLEYYQIIKTEIITQIRAHPTVTIDQARTYLNTNYPDSVIDFDQLYEFYLDLLGLANWDEFKTFVIDHKFEGVDT